AGQADDRPRHAVILSKLCGRERAWSGFPELSCSTTVAIWSFRSRAADLCGWASFVLVLSRACRRNAYACVPASSRKCAFSSTGSEARRARESLRQHAEALEQRVGVGIDLDRAQALR